MNALEGQQDWRKRPRKLQKNDSSDEDERGAHCEKNARCGHTREKTKKADKPREDRWV